MTHGINLADLLRYARRLGIAVRPLRRTGELQLSHPSIPRRPRVNGRRKDSPRVASDFVHEVEKLLMGSSGH